MKKGILLTIALATASLFASAQQLIPDGGFDNWSGNNIGNWAFVTGAHGSVTATGLQVNGSTITPHHGADALILQNNTQISTCGIVFPFTQRPTTLQGAFMYLQAATTERFIVSVVFTKWDAVNNKRDTILRGSKTINAQQVYPWALAQWDLTNDYLLPGTPDSAVVVLSASIATSPPTATANTFLLVDALNFNNITVGAPVVVTPILKVDNYPNPATTSTTITYGLSVASQVDITVTDITGKTVATVFSGEQSQGLQEVEFDVSSLKPGIYFYTVKAGNAVETKKMIVTK